MNKDYAGISRIQALGMAFLLTLAAPPIVVQADVMIPSQITAPTKIFRAKVIDASGEALIGVSVLVKGSQNGVVTDLDGNFSLSCSSEDVLVLSYIGYETQEIKASELKGTITLKENSELLDEVIVVGYGTTTRKSAVGAVDQVKSEAFTNRSVANMTQALQGVAPNVVIQQRSHNPNDNSTSFNIRGISTINDNSPLFVIDGLVADGAAFNRLNPMDIENISVLKDAGSSAIYGSRSANGVILVTTKKGSKGKTPKVTLSGMVGWKDPDILFRPVEGYQNAILRNLAATNVGAAPVYTPNQIQDLYNHRNEETWALDQIFRTALQQNYNVSVSGGTDKTQYMFSLGYFDQESNYVGNDNFGVQRYSMRGNITTEINRLKLTAIMSYTRNNSMSTTGANLEIDASRVPSYYYYKMKDEQGRYLLNDVWGEYNPLGQLESGAYNKFRNNSFTGSLSADFKIIEGLKLRGVLGVDVNNETRFTKNRPSTYYHVGSDTPRPVKDADFSVSNWNNDSYLINSQIMIDFNRTFGDHTISALAGLTNESNTYTANEINQKFVDKDLGIPTDSTTGEAGNITGKTSIEDQFRTSITSLIGRVGYNYKEKYLAEANFRYDGASKFHKDYRWGFFPSVSLGWRLTQEDFMESYRERIGDLKIRTSYGVLGSQAIGTYDRFTVYSIYNNNYAFNNKVESGAGFNLGKEDLTWEKTNSFDIGIDATFFNGDLRVSADYFNKRTHDILMTPIVPSIFGTGMPRDNIGEMRNQGWDLSVAYNLKTGKFRHEFNFNLGDSWNEVLSFPGKEQINQIEELSFIIREGAPLNSYYGYKMAGLFQSYDEIEASAIPVGAKVQPGDVKFVDRNSDGIIDSKDKFILGNAFPRFTYGFNYKVNYGDFDFSMFWQGVGKRTMMLRGELIEPFHANYSYTIYKHQLDFWTPTNTSARWPRLSAPGSDSDKNNYGNGNGSDLFLLDGKYLRLKNIVIGYTLPKSLTKKLGMQRCRLYVNGQDIFTFSNNSFIDPESSEFGGNMNNGGANSGRNYPTLKYWGFGVDVEF